MIEEIRQPTRLQQVRLYAQRTDYDLRLSLAAFVGR